MKGNAGLSPNSSTVIGTQDEPRNGKPLALGFTSSPELRNDH